MKPLHFSFRIACSILIVFLSSLLFSVRGQPAPTVVSTVPTNNATGVGTSTPFVTTFSTAMDTNATTVAFISTQLISTVDSWSADMTRLTNTPASGWPANQTITWFVSGQDTQGTALGGLPFGSFTTGTGGGGGGGGSGTNAITTFLVQRMNNYGQTSPSAPIVDVGIAYGFSALTTLASNRTATSISVKTPAGATNNLTQNFFAPENFYFFDSSSNFAAFDAQYSGGSYIFDVQAASSNQQVTVNLPASSTQPPAPHVSNYTAAQSIDPTKAFTLTWDTYTNGTTSDYIGVQIDTNFISGSLGASNALNGTATSIIIPANTLPPNRFFDSCYLTFYHFNAATNSSYATIGMRATSTRFFVTTTAGSVGTTPLVFTNLVHAGNGAFTFGLSCSASQTITIEYSTNVQSGWTALLSTNSGGNQLLTITDPQSAPRRFYRAHYGN